MGIKPNMYRSISGHVKDKQSIINRYNRDPSILFLLITSAGGEKLSDVQRTFFFFFFAVIDIY
jgi:hypothetical protein